MARRGFGGMTALRAALGAAVGVGEGLQQREVLAEQKRQRDLLEARQRAQDEAALRAEERQAVAAGMISADRIPTLTMPGATPLPDMQPTLRQTIGGKEYAYIPRMAQAEKHRGDVMKIALENASKTPTRRLQFSDGQIIDLEAGTATPVKGYVAPKKVGGGGGGGGRAATSASRADAQATNTQSTVIPEEIQKLRDMMPVPVFGTGDKANRVVGFKAPKTNLNTADIKLSQSDWTNWMASDEAQFYNSMVGSIADAKARRSEKGTLSNQDIQRYRNQVTIRIGDSDQTKYDKFQRLLRWAQEGGVAGGQGQATAAPPTPQPTPAQSDPNYEAAKQAIAQGANRDAVIRRYESGTGRKWPGG